ncbi:MAG: NAD(P)H-hydrate epimerase [Myxococcota bacterium]
MPADSIPWLTTDQMVEVDRAMISDFSITLVQMMENAGRTLAQLARARFLQGSIRGARVAVLAGPGGNGGGALVCARRLRNWGAHVEAFLSKPAAEFATVPRHQATITERMRIPTTDGPPLASGSFDLIVDGVIGYSLRGDPKGGAKTLIAWASEHDAPVLSLDVPSGIDTTTGVAAATAITATATMTLALPKVGLRAPAIHTHVGELYLADISVPPELYAGPGLGLDVPHIFAESDIVRLT